MAGNLAAFMTTTPSGSTSWDALENDQTKDGGSWHRFLEARSQRPFTTTIETIEGGDLNHSPATKPQTQTISHPTPTASQVLQWTPEELELGMPIFPDHPLTIDLSFLDGVEDEESGIDICTTDGIDICTTEERDRQGGSATEQLQAQEREECSEGGVTLNDEEWPAFATPYFLDAQALTYKEANVVHKSRSWADVVKGNRCSPQDP